MAEIKDKAAVMVTFSSLFMTCEFTKQFSTFSILVLNPILADLFLWSCFFMLSMLQLLSNDPFASVHYQSLVSIFLKILCNLSLWVLGHLQRSHGASPKVSFSHLLSLLYHHCYLDFRFSRHYLPLPNILPNVKKIMYLSYIKQQTIVLFVYFC